LDNHLIFRQPRFCPGIRFVQKTQSRAQTQPLKGHALSGQPGRTDVGPGWLQLGVCNARSSLGVSNAFTVVQKIAPHCHRRSGA